MSDKTFVRIPGFSANALSVATLEKIITLLKDHQVMDLKITGSHQLSIPPTDQHSLQAISKGLQQLDSGKSAEAIAKNHSVFTTIRTCPDSGNCKHGIRDITPITDLLDAIRLPGELPAKVKVSVAGCQMCCTAPFVRDIGLIAERKGWKLIFGGNSGGRPKIGDVIADGLTDEQAIELILRCLIIYIENAKPKMRTARFIEFYGVDRFTKEVLGDG